MISRVTNQMLLHSSQTNLQTQLTQLSAIQQKASSQKAFSKPSDDPAAMAQSLALRGQQAANTQYTNNAADATNWLNAVDGSLTSVTNIMQQVRSVVVQGANTGALSSNATGALVAQLQGLKAELMTQANTTYLGRPVFAGNSDTASAFNPDYSFNGVPGDTVTRRISATSTVPVSGDGAAVFGTGATSVFALIDSITSNLQSGVNVSSQLTAVDARLGAISSGQSTNGANTKQIQQGQAMLTAQGDILTTRRADVEDVDITKVVVDLQTQQVAYQAALAVTSKALQPTLLSFLQ